MKYNGYNKVKKKGSKDSMRKIQWKKGNNL